MISIIVLSYKNPALIRLCLRSIARALPVDLDYEVVVVDSASTPETRSVVTEEFHGAFPSLQLVAHKENTGYTRGNNEGFRAARGEYLIALNSDIVVEPGTIEALAQYLHDHPAVGLVGPRLMNFDETPQQSCFRFYRPFSIISRRLPWVIGAQREQRRFTMQGSDLSIPQSVDWISGAAYMTTRTAIERVGMLDELLFHYCSDVDWAWRFWENGYSVVYYPIVSLYHYLGRTSKGQFGIFDPLFNRATRWHIADARTYFKKHGTHGQRPTTYHYRQPQLINAS